MPQHSAYGNLRLLLTCREAACIRKSFPTRVSRYLEETFSITRLTHPSIPKSIRKVQVISAASNIKAHRMQEVLEQVSESVFKTTAHETTQLYHHHSINLFFL